MNARILVAEDDKANRYFLQRILAAEGYQVTVVADGRELVSRFREEVPDLVVTDVKMPMASGFQAVEEIRKDEHAAHVPVIFVSAAYRDIAAKFRGLEVGGNDYIPAPIDPDELLFRVKTNLRVKVLFDELIRSRAMNDQLLAENRRIMKRLFAVQENERRRIARELHDELGQWLSAVQAHACLIAGISEERVADIRASAEEIRLSVDAVFENVRRMIRDLRPVMLDALGLEESIMELLENWGKHQTGTTCRLEVQGSLGDLDESLAITIYRVIQEALTNVANHAAATRVDIAIRRTNWKDDDSSMVSVTISDNGRGFVPGSGREGTGLIGLRERVLSVLGTFELDTSPGHGVRILVKLPIGPNNPDASTTGSDGF